MLSQLLVNTRIRLPFLWATIMHLYIYADYFNLMTPQSLEKMMSLQTPVGPTTPFALIGFSVLLIVPALMIPVSIIAKPVPAKWLNVGFGIFYSLISLIVIFTQAGNKWMGFYIIYQFVELFIFFLLIKTALQWPKSSSLHTPNDN